MSIALILEMAESALGDRIALGARADGLTYRRVAAHVAGGAGVIADHAPTHVVFVGENGPAYPQALLAAASAGVPFVPMNYRLGDEALRGSIAEFGRPLVIADARYLARLTDSSPAMSTDDFLAQARVHRPVAPVDVAAGAPAVLLHTSGTTSRPKIVTLSHQNLLTYVMSTTEFASAGPDEAALVAVPPYHVAALGSALSNFYVGRRVVHLPNFDPARWLDLVATERVSSVMVVPTMLARIVDHLGGRVARTPSLRLIAYGGARMPRPVLLAALSAFPATGFCNAYGLTETSSTLALLGPEDHRAARESDDPVVRDRLGSVGRPVPGIEIEVRDEAGAVVDPGVVGELYVRGGQIAVGYGEAGSVLDAQGWFATRDRAWIDDDGYLFIGGRADDTIIRGGENIAPAEIEDVLYAHPMVRDVAVIGLPDDEWGQKLVAVVVPEPGADAAGTEVGAERLRAFVRSTLRGSRTPDEIVWTRELPTTPTGKVLRRKLIDLYAELSR